jgi:hypothetical protein
LIWPVAVTLTWAGLECPRPPDDLASQEAVLVAVLGALAVVRLGEPLLLLPGLPVQAVAPRRTMTQGGARR